MEPLVRCIKSSAPGFAAENVLYSARTKKLAVVVSAEAGRREYLEALPGLEVAKELMSVDQSTHAFSKLQVKGVIVTLRDVSQYDFVSRYFAPWVGIDEDPVTGSGTYRDCPNVGKGARAEQPTCSSLAPGAATWD